MFPADLKTSIFFHRRFSCEPLLKENKVNLFDLLLKAKKLYGDHCKIDSDCSSKLNYECQSGVCNCTSTTFYKSASDGCGWS
jgi:hypothetical protein